MSFAVTEVMQETGCWWPAAHSDATRMATLALRMQQVTSFDNVAVPFCMTVEAEALGSEVNYGTETVQPWITREVLQSVEEVAGFVPQDSAARDRRPVVLESISRLREAAPDLPVFGGVVGPFSLAAQLLEASLLLRAVHRQPEAVRALLHLCADFVVAFAQRQVQAGADVVAVADPTATGEILGRRKYVEFAEPYQRQVAATIQQIGVPVILHICGCPNALLGSLAEVAVGAISLDETADLHAAREALAGRCLMGNISAELLAEGPAEAIRRNAEGSCGQAWTSWPPPAGSWRQRR